MVIDGLGLSADAVRKFITDKHPTYAEFEGWVKQQPGVKLSRASSTNSTHRSSAIITATRRARESSRRRYSDNAAFRRGRGTQRPGRLERIPSEVLK